MHNDKIQSCIQAVLKRNNSAAFLLLVKHCSSIIRDCVYEIKVKGRNQDDIRQECLIALWSKVLVDFDYRRGEFKSFARLVLKRHLFSLIKAEQQQKRSILNKAVSLFAIHNHCCLFEVTPDPKALDPYDIVAEQDEKDLWANKLSAKLSKQEDIVFRGFYLHGQSYKEIATLLGASSTKTVDNALTRCRLKAQAFLTRYNVLHTIELESLFTVALGAK